MKKVRTFSTFAMLQAILQKNKCDNFASCAIYRLIVRLVLLFMGEVDSKKIWVKFSLENMNMSDFQDKTKYAQIKDYVLEYTRLRGNAV